MTVSLSDGQPGVNVSWSASSSTYGALTSPDVVCDSPVKCDSQFTSAGASSALYTASATPSSNQNVTVSWNSAAQDGQGIAELTKIITANGRKLWRHSSDQGTVMEYQLNGVTHHMIVLDAVYRQAGSLMFGVYGTDSSLPNCDGTMIQLEGSAKNYDSVNLPALTDAQLDAQAWGHDANTAKANCDVWMTLDTPVVHYARSLTINGVACDIPTVDQLARIFLMAEYIDSLDPTASANPTLCLGRSNTYGFWRIGNKPWVWSSGEYNASNCWGLGYDGRVYNNGTNKDNLDAILPILELD